MSVLISGLQNRVKNSAAYAEELGLMLISNGEEMPYLLAATGEKISAGITMTSVAPVVADNAAGTLINGKWVVYVAVYVSEGAFPLVAANIYSNGSEQSVPFEIGVTGGVEAGSRKLDVSAQSSTNTIVTHIYFYRTTLQDNQLLAETAADAGLLYFVGKVTNTTGVRTIVDDLLVNVGNDILEYTNFPVPQFRFAVWDGSYYWGFGNHPFRANATWDTDGTFFLSDPTLDKFFGGRNGQYLTFSGITTGGIDGRGTYLFSQTGDYSGQAQDADGNDTPLPSAGVGDIVIIGESATLYRSAYRNPFAWGYLKNIAGSYIPIQWQLKVSGSLGTAIAILPDQELLKLDMEFPALCVTFNLQAASSDNFEQTRRQVSRLYSVTSHFSQFSAISKGRQVLWGFDYKNLAIVECDGYTQIPISGPISIILRKLTKDRSLHLISHGIYDAVTEINAMWLSTDSVDEENAPARFDLCVYQHAPTGFWGIIEDYGILCSAPIEDVATSARTILVGTESGYIGKAFDPTTHGNWLPQNSLLSGLVGSAGANYIVRQEGQADFNPTALGLIGNFCYITNSVGLEVQVVQIAEVTADTLIFEQTLDPIPVNNSKFFIGLIEFRVLKYFDEGRPSQDKTPREYWTTLSDVEAPFVEFYAEHSETPGVTVQLQRDGSTDAWFNKLEFPTAKGKTYGLALVERSYNPTKFFNFTIK